MQETMSLKFTPIILIYNKHTFIEQLTVLYYYKPGDSGSTHKSLPIITASYPRRLESVFNANFWEKLQQTYISTYYSTQSWQTNHFTFSFDRTYPQHDLQCSCSINIATFWMWDDVPWHVPSSALPSCRYLYGSVIGLWTPRLHKRQEFLDQVHNQQLFEKNYAPRVHGANIKHSACILT